MSFWGSLFGGSSSGTTSALNNTGNIASFAQGQGQSNTTAGSNFFQSLLSGDSSKTSAVLAPQISAAKTSLQQDQKTSAQNGTRSGGTAASNAAAKDKIHSDITNLTGNLTGGAAGTLLSSGSSLLGTALSGYGQQSNIAAQQAKQWQDSIFGKAISGGVGALEGAGMGKLFSGGSGSGSYPDYTSSPDMG